MGSSDRWWRERGRGVAVRVGAETGGLSVVESGEVLV